MAKKTAKTPVKKQTKKPKLVAETPQFPVVSKANSDYLAKHRERPVEELASETGLSVEHVREILPSLPKKRLPGFIVQKGSVQLTEGRSKQDDELYKEFHSRSKKSMLDAKRDYVHVIPGSASDNDERQAE